MIKRLENIQESLDITRGIDNNLPGFRASGLPGFRASGLPGLI
jgi:hypothetical protein